MTDKCDCLKALNDQMVAFSAGPENMDVMTPTELWDRFHCAIRAALPPAASEPHYSSMDYGGGPFDKDGREGLNEKPDPAASKDHGTAGEAQGAGEPGCVCKGNWRLIVKEMESLVDRVYRNDRDGSLHRLFGVVDAFEDYYYGMSDADGKCLLLSCVGSIEGHGYILQPEGTLLRPPAPSSPAEAGSECGLSVRTWAVIDNKADSDDSSIMRTSMREVRDFIAAQAARVKELTGECEQLQVQLAGCGAAALQNTPSSVTERAKPGDYGYSSSYYEICRAVDREIVLRSQLTTLQAENEGLRREVANVTHDTAEPQSVTDPDGCPKEGAVLARQWREQRKIIKRLEEEAERGKAWQEWGTRQGLQMTARRRNYRAAENWRRCEAIVRLRDGSTANCMRAQVVGSFCTQHAALRAMPADTKE